jgi:hypothetical protein
MRLVLFAIPAAVLIGYLVGGRLAHLAGARFRWPVAGLAGIGLQLAPVEGTGGRLLLIASFLLLVVAAAVNLRLPGFALILTGLCLNFTVIAVDGGMPVTQHALVASGQQETLTALKEEGGSKHHLASSSDELLALADSIPIPPPVGRAVSVGDLLAYTGAVWFVIAGMRRRDEVPSTEQPPPDHVAEASP